MFLHIGDKKAIEVADWWEASLAFLENVPAEERRSTAPCPIYDQGELVASVAMSGTVWGTAANALFDPYAIHNRPCAATPLTSYRARSGARGGWIMIGASDPTSAIREAQRAISRTVPITLEVWDGRRYVKVPR